MLCEQQSKKGFANPQKKLINTSPGQIVAGKPDPLVGLSRARKEDPVLQSWGSYLDAKDWQLWTTLTTGRELTLPGARRSINKLAGYLKQHHYPAEIFWAAEPFDLKEGFHLHSLIRFTELSLQDDNKRAYGHLVDGWRQITGDKTARIQSERYKPD